MHVIDLDHGFLRVAGPDARSFLQGQLSSDLRTLSAERAQISSYNSPKGRMLAVAHLVEDGEDAVLVELHRSIFDATLKRLRMFVLRSKLTIEAAEQRALGVVGTDAPERLAAAGLPAPQAPLHCARDEAREVIVMRRFGDRPRYSLIASADTIEALRNRLGGERAGDDAWRRADIEAGVPVVYPQTADHFVPQMANLDLLGGIGFDKGCYTGQEIVARLHYLGQLKRRMFVCGVEGRCPEPGSDVVAGEPPSTTGEIVDAVADGAGALATVVLQLAQADARDLRLRDGSPVRVLRQSAA